MLKHTLVLIAVLSLTVVTRTTLHAQTTDFSGTWTLDQEASQFPQPPGGGGGRDGGGGGGGGRRGGGRGGLGAGATIVITQTETVLSMEQQAGGQSRTVVYRLDGSESTSVAGRGEMTTTSRWDGAALVTEGTNVVSTPRGELTLDIHERRTLSPDGQTMTVESTRTTPRGELNATVVYRKSN